MKIAWKKLPGGRAIAPHDVATGERLPFTVCSYGQEEDKRYEAWDKRGAWSSCLATRLQTADEAKALVLAELAK